MIGRLGVNARVGTSSVRRIAQLAGVFTNAQFLPIRGNLDTRLRKLDSGEFDAIVLASAGLRRLGFAYRISTNIPPHVCVPAPGQGIIAIEVRAGDGHIRRVVADLDDAGSHAALDAERAVVRRLGGGCQMPIGAYAALEDHGLHLHAIVISLDGTRTVRAEAVGAATAAEALGLEVADRLLAQGASDILEEVERAHGAVGGIQP